jgi:uncharacterized membrane protein
MRLVVSLMSFLVLDSFYLGYMSDYYKKLIYDIQKSPMKLKLAPTLGVYIIIMFSWYYFIYKNITPNTNYKSIMDSAILGFCMYSLFDLTNHAILKNWDIKTVVIDSLWGMILYTIPTTIYLIST